MWITRDNKPTYDNEVMIWVSKHPPRINSKTGLFSRRHIGPDEWSDYEFTVMDAAVFKLIFQRTIKPGERLKVKVSLEEVD